MKIDMNQKLVDFKGKLMTFQEEELDLGGACISALGAMFQKETDIDYRKKLKRYDIAERIHKAQEKKELCELTAPEIAEIIDVTAKMWPSLVFGKINHLLEAGSEK